MLKNEKVASESELSDHMEAIAIIGMSGRFPGAKDLHEFWTNIKDGVCSISSFTEQEMLHLGVSEDTLQNPLFVKAEGYTPDIELFAASFFGYSPREAESIDPQQRIFLEEAWHALEDAGYDPNTYAGSIGVYAGVGRPTYLWFNLLPHERLFSQLSGYELLIGNEKEFLPTRVSYKCNLKGPSVNIQTACSTSLVAVHFACQSLLNYQCDMALAGAVCIKVPQQSGYVYEEGGILSPDGYCRAFDAQACGTVGGNGLGIVVLKRLQEALADGDTIHAIIRGSAINNDGALKAGFTAPSIQGQAEVITEALTVAGVEAESISYIEAHGTGTVLGDPIEVAALTQAFRDSTARKRFCALGSVKTNIGHLDVAAGMAGLLKVVLALTHRQLPPSLHFQQPNPQIKFANSPFYIPTALTTWDSVQPRRAGVSSFGIGGTNAHLIVEEAPQQVCTSTPHRWQLLILSAKTSSALAHMCEQVAEHLQGYPEQALADVAYTLQVGRTAFAHRIALLVEQREQAIAALRGDESPAEVGRSLFTEGISPEVIFLFPGQGTQYVHMGQELYEQEPVFRAEIERAARWLKPRLGLDIRKVLYPSADQEDVAGVQLRQTWLGQPTLFVVEYALAVLWKAWGVQPQAMLGHSLGEYVAATLAGVFSWEDALSLVVARGRLMQQLPEGVMLAVALSQEEVQQYTSEEVSLAAMNGPEQCVLAGTRAAISAVEEQLVARKVGVRWLKTTYAFHSQQVEPIMEQFAKQVGLVQLHEPQKRYISNMTGSWIKPEEASSVAYWVRHLRETVQWSEGVKTIYDGRRQVYVEVGPGHLLGQLVRQQLKRNGKEVQVLASLDQGREKQGEYANLQRTAGRLWLEGVSLEWKGRYEQERRQRVPLPTYPFERQRYWIEPVSTSKVARRPSSAHENFLSKSNTMVQDIDPTCSKEAVESVKEGITQRCDEEMSEETPAISSLNSAGHSRPKMQNVYTPPTTELEVSVAEVWQDILGIEAIGIHDDFLELGGHSLLGVRIVSQLREIFDIDLGLQHLLAQPTIANLALIIEELCIEEVEKNDRDKGSLSVFVK